MAVDLARMRAVIDRIAADVDELAGQWLALLVDPLGGAGWMQLVRRA